MEDPLVQLSFDPAKRSFEPAPPALVELIAKERKVKLGKHWVFASFDDPATGDRYLVVSGFMRRVEEDAKPPRVGSPEPNPGVLAVFQGGSYKIMGDVGGFGVGMFQMDIPNNVMKPLMRDYVARLTRAWGGKDNVQKAIAEQWTQTNGIARLQKPMAEAMREAGISNVCAYRGSNIPNADYCD
jgi:hypothetical protein